MNDLYLIGNGFDISIEKVVMRFYFKTVRRFIIVFAILLLFCISTFGHSGRTDSNGGHFNRKTGKYHTHNNGESRDGNGAIIWGVVFVVIVFGAIAKGAINDDK